MCARRFGNAIAEISVVSGHQAGNYRIHRDTSSVPGLNTSYRSRRSQQGVVTISTAYGSIGVRIGIKSNSTEEQNIVNGYQNASSISVLPLSAPDAVPALSEFDLTGASDTQGQLDLAAKLAPYNPPQTISDRDRVNRILAQAGISEGIFTLQQNTNLSSAATSAANSIYSDATNPEHWNQLNNNWSIPIPSYQANYGTHYAAIANYALSFLQSQQIALYPHHPILGGNLTASVTSSWLITYSSKPPLTSSGSWNVAVYDGKKNIIANPINRYNIGSYTSDLKYTSGGDVNDSDADDYRDGEFRILLQLGDVPPPANWTGNWLPVTESFTLACTFLSNHCIVLLTFI